MSRYELRSGRHVCKRRHRRTALKASAALVAAMMLGGHGTYAYWNDEASVRSTQLTAGTVDIALDGNLRGSAGSGGTWDNPGFALDAMLPGESRAVGFPVGNAGTAPLTYAVTASGSGALLAGLRFSLYTGGQASNSGTASQGTRSGSCGGTALATRVTVTSSASAVTTARRTLAPAATETVCLVVELDASAGNELQGATAATTFVFEASQVIK